MPRTLRAASAAALGSMESGPLPPDGSADLAEVEGRAVSEQILQVVVVVELAAEPNQEILSAVHLLLRSEANMRERSGWCEKLVQSHVEGRGDPHERIDAGGHLPGLDASVSDP